MSVSNIIEPIWTIFYGIFRLCRYNGTMTSLLNSSFFRAPVYELWPACRWLLYV